MKKTIKLKIMFTLWNLHILIKVHIMEYYLEKFPHFGILHTKKSKSLGERYRHTVTGDEISERINK